jgi:hypothetical protein
MSGSDLGEVPTVAAADGDVRIIDESGEDYLYLAGRFVPIDVPAEIERALTAAG